MYTQLKNQFDPLDREILEELSHDARIAFSQLAKKLRVSNSLIHQRVRKLKAAGVLEDAVFVLNPQQCGFETCAYTQIMISHPNQMKSVIEALTEIPEIVECVYTAGRYDIMVKMYAINNRHLRDILYEKIQRIEGVEGTNTMVSFETAFSRGVSIKVAGLTAPL